MHEGLLPLLLGGTYHEWVEMPSGILAVVPQLSLHVDVESVLSLGQAVNLSRYQDCFAGVPLLHVKGAVDAAVSPGNQLHSGYLALVGVIERGGGTRGRSVATTPVASICRGVSVVWVVGGSRTSVGVVG